jgi:hypothetical protein
MNSWRVTGKPEVVLKLEAFMGGKRCEKVVRGWRTSGPWFLILPTLGLAGQADVRTFDAHRREPIGLCGVG